MDVATVMRHYKIQLFRLLNGINLSKCIPKENYLCNDSIKILHIGRFSEQKNHVILIEAFRLFHANNKSSRLELIGDGEKMPAAFIQPNFEFVREWATRHNLNFNTNEELCANKMVIDRIQEEINHSNEKFGNWEKVKRFELTPDVWSIVDGHLTPTMKLKRKIIKEKYNDLYQKIYG